MKDSPNFPDAHDNLGLALARKGQFNAAQAEFEETLRLDPDNSDAKKNLAKISGN